MNLATVLLPRPDGDQWTHHSLAHIYMPQPNTAKMPKNQPKISQLIDGPNQRRLDPIGCYYNQQHLPLSEGKKRSKWNFYKILEDNFYIILEDNFYKVLKDTTEAQHFVCKLLLVSQKLFL